MRIIAGLFGAIAISTAGLLAQAPAEVTYIGCVRAWKPAPPDVTRMPESKIGMYVLTPIASSATVSAEIPTYLLTPTQTVNFAAHLDDKVEVVGVVQTAPMPPTVRELVGALGAVSPRPEEQPTTQSMPRLTVRSLKKISDACPS